jgi:ABC-2 type transport system ATP-binding protein
MTEAGHHRRSTDRELGPDRTAVRADRPESRPTSESRETDDVAVSVRGVSKTFRLGTSAKTFKERMLHRSNDRSDFQALTDVSFDIKQGETFGIIGHNGSGKSTLLKLISGIMRPTSGDILVRGRLAALLELGAGFHPDLTGTENIYLNGSILGFNEDYIDDAYDDIVAFAELEEFISTPVKHYSSGMRARLGFSVATHLEPDVLLIDEVLAVGDESFKRKCMERVHRFRSLNRTMVLVSHSASTVGQLCSRSAVLAHGEVVFIGDSDDAIKAHRAELSNRSADRTARTRNRPGTIEQASPVRSVGTVFASGEVEPAVKPGDDVSLVTNLEVNESIAFRIRLSLRTEEGLVLLNRATTGLLGGPLQLEAGRHRLAFTLHHLPLRDGRYIIDVIVESEDGSRRFDRDGGAAVFQVDSGTRGLGLVVVDMSCEVLDAESAVENELLAKGPA